MKKIAMLCLECVILFFYLSSCKNQTIQNQHTNESTQSKIAKAAKIAIEDFPTMEMIKEVDNQSSKEWLIIFYNLLKKAESADSLSDSEIEQLTKDIEKTVVGLYASYENKTIGTMAAIPPSGGNNRCNWCSVPVPPGSSCSFLCRREKYCCYFEEGCLNIDNTGSRCQTCGLDWSCEMTELACVADCLLVEPPPLGPQFIAVEIGEGIFAPVQ